ncbi:MAG: hypothetical protein KC731_28085 [Myxococcales bacterium]|nr:hypothetical protein [Myxococcales bacterium]
MTGLRAAWLTASAALVAVGACGGDTTAFDSVGGGGAGEGGDPMMGGMGGAPTTATGTGGEGGMAPPPFVLEVATQLDMTGVLSLLTNLPADIGDCLALDVVGLPCEDLDEDGLNDPWETIVLDRFRPFLRLDEAEKLVDDPGFVTGIVGRVTPRGGDVLVYMMLGYEHDFGSCGGFSGHNGDSERVVLELRRVDGSVGDAALQRAYTAAHEGTLSDHGMIFEAGSLASLVFDADPMVGGEPRWVVFPSANKHATYANVSICEGISPLPCFDEDCAPDNVPDPTPFTRLMPFVNAGEPDHHLIDELTPIGFPGEDAWLDQSFCGGLGGIGCASSVVSKLVNDPFP